MKLVTADAVGHNHDGTAVLNAPSFPKLFVAVDCNLSCAVHSESSDLESESAMNKRECHCVCECWSDKDTTEASERQSLCLKAPVCARLAFMM